MKKLLGIVFLSLLFSGSAFAGTCKTPKNPKEKFVLAPEPVSYTRKSPTNRIEEVLSKRKTINVFKAWTWQKQNYENYGLQWNVNGIPFSKNYFNAIEIRWNYAYPLNGTYPGIKKYLTKRNWGHDKEYGKTLAINLKSKDYSDYLLNVIKKLNTNIVDGILLDWWHNRHKNSGGYSEKIVKNFRIELAKKIQTEFGNDFLIIGNVNWDRDTGTHNYINGVFMELYKNPYKYTGGYNCKEIRLMGELLKFHDQNLREPRIIAFEPWRITKKLSKEKVYELSGKTENDKIDLEYLEKIYRRNFRSSDENIRFAKLFTAMAMVIPENGYILYADNNPDNPKGDHDHDFYDFYNTDLGKETSIGMEISEGLGFKMYEKGVIVYNYTLERYKIKFTNQKEVTIDPLQGMFVEF